MAISKLIFNNVTQMDATTTTATEADVASGKTFLLADGTVGTGTASGGGGSPTIDSLSITPSESEQTFNSSSVDGYKPVTVDAISSTYVGSGIARKSSTDLTVSGATVTAPAGYYASNASKSVTTMTLPTAVSSSATSGYTSKATVSRSTSDQYINIAPGYNSVGGYYKINAVANGSAGTPSASKSTVSNHSISVTPSVTNVTGYITGGTKTGTAVSVSASELVSGNKEITSNGTNIDVTNYATVSVDVAGITPSGTLNITSNDTYDVTNYASANVNVSGGDSKNAQTVQQNNTRVASTTYVKACGDITVAKSGTYNVYWTCYRTSTSGTWGTYFYKNDTAQGNAQTTFSSYYQTVHLSNVSLAKNDVISVYARSRSNSYYAYVGQLTIIEA